MLSWRCRRAAFGFIAAVKNGAVRIASRQAGAGRQAAFAIGVIFILTIAACKYRHDENQHKGRQNPLSAMVVIKILFLRRFGQIGE